MSKSPPLPLETITHRILLLRGHCERAELKAPGTRRRPPCWEKVLLDSELAALYDVPTKRFNEQVKRNLERFPADFMFQLTEEEWESLRSQIATSNEKPSGRWPWLEETLPTPKGPLTSDAWLGVGVKR